MEVVSAPQILATLPLSYRNTDGAALSFTPRPLKPAKEKAHSPTPIGQEGRRGDALIVVCFLCTTRACWSVHNKYPASWDRGKAKAAPI